MKSMKKWDKKSGVDQNKADLAAKGVNKPASEVLKESFDNLRSVFTGNVRANTSKSNEKKKNGTYPGR